MYTIVASPDALVGQVWRTYPCNHGSAVASLDATVENPQADSGRWRDGLYSPGKLLQVVVSSTEFQERSQISAKMLHLDTAEALENLDRTDRNFLGKSVFVTRALRPHAKALA